MSFKIWTSTICQVSLRTLNALFLYLKRYISDKCLLHFFFFFFDKSIHFCTYCKPMYDLHKRSIRSTGRWKAYLLTMKTTDLSFHLEKYTLSSDQKSTSLYQIFSFLWRFECSLRTSTMPCTTCTPNAATLLSFYPHSKKCGKFRTV